MHYYPGAAERLSDWKSKQSIPIIIEWSKQRLEQLDSRLQAPLPTISSRDATPKKVEEEAKKRAKEEPRKMLRKWVAQEVARKMVGWRGSKENCQEKGWARKGNKNLKFKWYPGWRLSFYSWSPKRSSTRWKDETWTKRGLVSNVSFEISSW